MGLADHVVHARGDDGGASTPGPIAPTIHGSRRFLFGASFQPSEFAKLAVVVWVSMLIVKKGDALKRFTKGLIPFVLVVGALDVLAALEPDLSVAMLSRCSWRCFCSSAARAWATSSRLARCAFRCSVRRSRNGATPCAHHGVPASGQRAGRGELPAQAIAHRRRLGWWFGRGFGEGMQQAFFVPFPYSDFVASNVGEEWGFVGIVGVTVAFALYGLLGFRIARQARTPFLQLVAVGLTFTTVLTAFLHIGVVIGLLPTTGLTLPFVSYGRSNLVLTLLFTGILVNIGSAVSASSAARDRSVGRRSLTRPRPAAGHARIIVRGRRNGRTSYPGIAIARALVRARPSLRAVLRRSEAGASNGRFFRSRVSHVLLDLASAIPSRRLEQRQDVRRRDRSVA